MVGKAPCSLDRRAAVAALLAERGDALVVTGLGSPSYDVHAAGDVDANYYLWGAMGSAALVGLGIALAQPKREVMVITGDGEQLMAFGSFATIATAAPSNLSLYVLDNERYGETGMQESHTARGLSLAAVAESCGFAETTTVDDETGLNSLITQRSRERSGPTLAVIKVEANSPPRSLPPRDAVFIKNRFRGHLGLSPN